MLDTLIVTDNRLPVFCADDRIFLGEGLFETIRIEEGRAIYPRLHWDRMQSSAKKLGIFFDLRFEQWCEHLKLSISKAALSHGGIKVLLSGGPAKRGLNEKGENTLLTFHSFEYLKIPEPLQLVSAKWLRDANNPIYEFKSINYLESIIARRSALDIGADDVLFFNLDRFAMETTVANIFIIYKDKIYTPPLSDGLLPGVMRARVLSLCTEAGITFNETSIDRERLYEADAMFTVNVLQGLKPVKLMDKHPFSVSHPLLLHIQKLLADDAKRWDS